MSFSTGGAGGSQIATSQDVALSSVADNNALVYDAGVGKWVNQTSSEFAAAVQSVAGGTGNTYTVIYNTSTNTWPARPSTTQVPAGCAIYTSPASASAPTDRQLLDIWRKY
jgi:hypothetical protein